MLCEAQPNYYSQNYYYTQAAPVGQDENPFLADVGAQDPLAGDKSRNGQSRNNCPPARPPPPRMNETVDSSMMVQKSAFDDLNDTIKTALTSASPSKSIPFVCGAVGQTDTHQSVAGLFSSSSQQHAFAQPQMFSSTVMGHTINSNLSSSAIGGGSE